MWLATLSLVACKSRLRRSSGSRHRVSHSLVVGMMALEIRSSLDSPMPVPAIVLAVAFSDFDSQFAFDRDIAFRSETSSGSVFAMR